MGLRDWWRRQVEGDRPEPAIPQPPGETEILASLARVGTMLGEGAVSPLVRSRVARVDRLIRAILPRLSVLGVGSADAYAVVATATDYLPESLAAYLRLPRDWADTRPIDAGRTALMVLIDQLELLGATMEKMLDAAAHADANALIAHGQFLQARFGTSASGGSLDLSGPANGTGGLANGADGPPDEAGVPADETGDRGSTGHPRARHADTNSLDLG